MEPTMVDSAARPTGRDDVMGALKQAALELLAEQGMSFSIRQVASRANVNHGLIHRHFGSKQTLVNAALADRNRALSMLIAEGATSPLDVGLRGEPSTAVLLARLILDDATSLIGAPQTSHAIVDLANQNVDHDDPLTAAHRAALANAISLGWAVFGNYALDAAGATANNRVLSKLQGIVNDLLGTPITGTDFANRD